MNEELKLALKTQGEKVRGAVARHKAAKNALEEFDANSRIAINAENPKMNLDDTKARVTVAPGRRDMTARLVLAEADAEGIDADTKCLLAHVSLVCSETAAMSRISQ